MSKNQPAKPAITYRSERIPLLMATMGIEDHFSRYAIEQKIQSLAVKFWGARASSGDNRRLRQYAAALQKSQDIWRQLEPMHPAIELAGFLRNNPQADEDTFTIVKADGDQAPSQDLHGMQEDRIRDVEHLIRNAGDYRKRMITKLIVEPFLALMSEHGVVPSKTLPLSRMFAALFDVVGLEPRHRGTDVTIRNAVRRLKRNRGTV